MFMLLTALVALPARPAVAGAVEHSASLIANHADGSSAVDDLSQQDAPRQLPVELALPPSPPTPSESRIARGEATRRMRIASGVLVLGGALLGALSGLLFYQADMALRAAHKRSEAEQAACRTSGAFICLTGFSEIFAGFPETIGAYAALGVGVAHVASGITLFAISERRRSRELPTRNFQLTSTPGSSQISRQAASSILQLALEF